MSITKTLSALSRWPLSYNHRAQIADTAQSLLRESLNWNKKTNFPRMRLLLEERIVQTKDPINPISNSLQNVMWP